MSVIVHGWKMPTDCGGCEFMYEDVDLHEPDCRCCLNRMENVTNNFYNGNRPEWCPLEEVKEDVK